MITTLIGLVVGMIAAIVFSYAVVNFFYPKETNLIVGLCMGAAVGLAPVIAARGFIALTGR